MGKAFFPIIYFRKIPLFSKLGKANLEAIRKIAQIKVFKEGDYIISEGEVGDALYIVYSGLVKIYKKSYGKIKTLALLKKGDFFGEMAIIDKESRSASAYSMEESTLILVQRREFSSILKENNSFSQKIIETLCIRLRKANRDIEMLCFQNVIGRLSMVLLDLADKYGVKESEGTRIDVKLTKKELSEIVGTAREVISRVMHNLVSIGCIAMENDYLVIKDREKLTSWIQ